MVAQRSTVEPIAPPLVTLSLRDLLSNEYPPLQWVIPDLLPEGLTLLFSRPKLGKSMVALALSLRLASGKAGVQGDVLYLTLDDRSQRRLQSRVRSLLDGVAVDDGLDFAFESARLGEGLIGQLDDYLDARPQTRMIVVDVYAAIKSKSQDSDVFHADYAALASLRAFAERRHVAVLLVHHSRKKSDPDDWISEINGTTGLSAAVDTIWKLDRKRGGTAMVLLVTGRDISDGAIRLELEDLEAPWQEIDEDGATKSETPTQSETQRILQYLQSVSLLRPKEAAAALDMNPHTARKLLSRLASRGLVVQTRYGCYTLSQSETLAQSETPCLTSGHSVSLSPLPFPTARERNEQREGQPNEQREDKTNAQVRAKLLRMRTQIVDELQRCHKGPRHEQLLRLLERNRQLLRGFEPASEAGDEPPRRE